MARPAGDIVIAGGGIGGLATALALANRGLPSIVCERRTAFSEDGAGIQIGPNGVRLLRALGVADALQPNTSAPDAISVRLGATARELTRLPLGQWIADRHGAPYWTAHRQDLHAALLAAATAKPLISFRLGADINAWRDAESGVVAVTSDGATVSGRGLIAADGLWSRLRSAVCPSAAAPAPVRKAAFRCVAPISHLPRSLRANDVQLWLAPGAHAVHYPVRSGREIAVVIIVDDARAETTWGALAAPDLSSPPISGFAPPLLELLQNARAWRMWSLYAAAPLDRWTAGRVALLGDAAHPILPFLAQGAVLAMEDAQSIAACLADADEPSIAFERFAARRMGRARRVAAAATRNGRVYHLNGAMALARNATLSATPPQRLMAGYDWIYGWRE